MTYLGDFAAGDTVFVYFDSFDGLGASASITGLALADIKVYKNGSVTQRSSTAGFTLLDTDGIDFDAIVGINGFSLDLSNNTDAGFWAAGNDYTVVVDSITLESQTVSFIAAKFSIENRSVATVQAVTDQMVFTNAGEVDANTKSINDATVVGDGNTTPWDGA